MIESLIAIIAVIIYFIIAYKCVKIFFNWYNKRSAGKNLYSENQSSSTELDPSYIEGVLDENDSPDEILGIRTEDLSYTTKIGLVGLKAMDNIVGEAANLGFSVDAKKALKAAGGKKVLFKSR